MLKRIKKLLSVLKVPLNNGLQVLIVKVYVYKYSADDWVLLKGDADSSRGIFGFLTRSQQTTLKRRVVVLSVKAKAFCAFTMVLNMFVKAP